MLPRLVRHAQERAASGGSSIVDENVEPAVIISRALNEGLHLFGNHDVGLDSGHTAPGLLTYF